MDGAAASTTNHPIYHRESPQRFQTRLPPALKSPQSALRSTLPHIPPVLHHLRAELHGNYPHPYLPLAALAFCAVSLPIEPRCRFQISVSSFWSNQIPPQDLQWSSTQYLTDELAGLEDGSSPIAAHLPFFDNSNLPPNGKHNSLTSFAQTVWNRTRQDKESPNHARSYCQQLPTAPRPR